MSGSSLATGVIWNMAALAFLAIAGIALNLAIGRFYGPEALGVFNVSFAIYIFVSQIASFGLQFSVLHAVSVTKKNDPRRLAHKIYSGLILCAAIAVTVTLASIAATPLIGQLFPRVPNLSTAWLVVTPGLVPFALNKYLLGVVNGLQHMRAYAVFQAARFVGILSSLGLMLILGVPSIYLTAILPLAELILLIGLAGYVFSVVPPIGLSGVSSEIRHHAAFGLRVFPAGMIAELNTRVDVLMLGAIADDRAVGIYTIAALVYESALQAVVVIRNNISPQLARNIHDGKIKEILDFSRKLGVTVAGLATVGAVLSVLLFPTFVQLAFPGSEFSEASRPLFWLMLALVFAAAPLCYSLILSQAGRPGWQSVAMIAMLLVNGMLSATLIPMLGIAGAGMAMGLSAVVGGLIIVVLSRLVLGVRLFA